MALVEGTNCGFVSSRPSGDPGGTDMVAETNAWATRSTSPAGSDLAVVEIGFYIDNATAAADMDLGIYTNDGSEPNELVGSITISKGTTAGWKYGSCNIAISSETQYHIAAQVDSSSGCNGNYQGSGGDTVCGKYSQSSLPSTWGSSDQSPLSDYLIAAYAIVQEVATGTNIQINVDDDWKEVEEIKINVDDSWKSVTAAKINKDDTWKEVF